MEPAADKPTLYVFAGPNGAGKSTYFEELKKREPGIQQINADVTAAQNPQMGALGVGSIMARQAKELSQNRESFSWETNLAKQSNYKMFQGYQEQGYKLDITYVNLQTVELCKNRVAQRVAAGGHPIPEKQIEERYVSALELIKQNYKVPDRLELVDNSGKEQRTVLTLEQGKIVQQAPELPKWAADIKSHIQQMESQEVKIASARVITPQEQFKEAASSVAAGLRETGQPADALAAARLQEVSRFVERVPHIAGINKENVEKALVAAEQIPGLAGSRQVVQLQSATAALEQPGLIQQREQPGLSQQKEQPRPELEANLKAAASLYQLREPERQEARYEIQVENAGDPMERGNIPQLGHEGKGGTTPSADQWLDKDPDKVLTEAARSTVPKEHYIIINTTGLDEQRLPMRIGAAEKLYEAGAGTAQLETRAAQSGQPEQGQVRVAYQVNQPTLDAIHHEVEQLRSKPGIQIIEPEGQRSERAQVLAVQYEQALQKQQEATRSEAKELFVQAALPVAQALRENGEGLNAARLQEATRFIERTPYLGGINKENVDKAIAAADKIPSLNDSRDLAELKSSVSVLEKQPTQERANDRSTPSRESGDIER